MQFSMHFQLLNSGIEKLFSLLGDLFALCHPLLLKQLVCQTNHALDRKRLSISAFPIFQCFEKYINILFMFKIKKTAYLNRINMRYDLLLPYFEAVSRYSNFYRCNLRLSRTVFASLENIVFALLTNNLSLAYTNGFSCFSG